MKNARKIFAAFIAVLTLLVCVLPASAATNENKLIDTSKKVSLTLNCNKAGYTFSVYKVATLGSNASATKYTSTNAAYGIDEALNKGNNAALLTKLDAVSYKVPSRYYSGKKQRYRTSLLQRGNCELDLRWFN